MPARYCAADLLFLKSLKESFLIGMACKWILNTLEVCSYQRETISKEQNGSAFSPFQRIVLLPSLALLLTCQVLSTSLSPLSVLSLYTIFKGMSSVFV